MDRIRELNYLGCILVILLTFIRVEPPKPAQPISYGDDYDIRPDHE